MLRALAGIALFVTGALVSIPPAAAADKIPVMIEVSSVDAVTATQVRRRMYDAISGIDGVEVVEWDQQFKLTIVALKLELSTRVKVGYALSVVVTTPYDPTSVTSLLEPEMRDYGAMLMENAETILQHSIQIVPGELFDEATQEIADEFNLRVLDPYREHLQSQSPDETPADSE